MPIPSVINPAFNQFSQSSGPVSGKEVGRVGCEVELPGIVQVTESVYDSNRHRFDPSEVVTQM